MILDFTKGCIKFLFLPILVVSKMSKDYEAKEKIRKDKQARQAHR